MHSHHDHGAMHTRAGARYQRRLWLTFLLVVSFFVVEVVAGFLTGSLALLSDAGHMLADAVGLGMALAAIHVATRVERAGRHTFGLYRLEILAALANAILLFGVAVYVLIEAVRRFQAPITVLSGPMLAVALLGLGVNLVGVVLLRQGASESLNVEGAFLEVLADLLGSVGVVIAAVILLLTGWPYADSLFAATIGLFILPRAWHLGRRAGHILLQAAPAALDLEALRSHLTVIPGVAAVHDLHVWTLTSGMEVGSVHLRVRQGADTQAVLTSAQDILRDHGVGHVTVQVESTAHDGKTCQWEG